jgi:hypothetical protein
MDPISATVEKKALDSVIDAVRKLWSWHTDVVKENKALKERLDTKAEFERKKAALKSRQEDDNLYRDANGTLYCPLCLNADSKFIPVVHHFEGSYYCSLHKQVFETEERRTRKRGTVVAPPQTPGGPNGWMR